MQTEHTEGGAPSSVAALAEQGDRPIVITPADLEDEGVAGAASELSATAAPEWEEGEEIVITPEDLEQAERRLETITLSTEEIDAFSAQLEAAVLKITETDLSLPESGGLPAVVQATTPATETGARPEARSRNRFLRAALALLGQ